MSTEHEVAAVRLSPRLRGVSPLVTRRIWIGEQASLAELHAVLQVAFGWSDEHLYALQIRGWQFGDPSRAIELALAGGGVDSALAAFGFEIGEPFTLPVQPVRPLGDRLPHRSARLDPRRAAAHLPGDPRRSYGRGPRWSGGLSAVADG